MVTNEEMLRRANGDRTLRKDIGQMEFFGHVIRKEELEKEPDAVRVRDISELSAKDEVNAPI